jgi:simple sugar transport system permease protein
VPLRAGLVNIGGEGQMIAGGLACAVIGAALPGGTPAMLALPIVLVAAIAGGGAIGAVTGALRVYRGAHEVIVAILLNAIVAGVALWLGNEWLFVGDATRTATVVPGAQLAELGITGSSVSYSVVVALLAAGAVGWVQTRSIIGYRWRMIGAGPEAALTAGIDVARQRLVAMTVGGALAGLAGAHFVLGHKHAFEEGLGRNQGFIGIAVALLAQGRASAILLSAVVFGALGQGGIEVAELVPKEIVDVLQAVVVLVAAATLGRQRVR